MKVVTENLKRNILLSMVVLLTLASASPVCAANINLNDRSGSSGSDITFAVSVHDAPNDVATFGFDVQYDVWSLRYSGFSRGSLVDNFDFVNVNNCLPGTVRVGGFVATTAGIVQGESGTLVLLSFQVVGEEDCGVKLAALKDNMQGWSTRPGQFTAILTPEEEKEETSVSPEPSSLAEAAESGEMLPDSNRQGVSPSFDARRGTSEKRIMPESRERPMRMRDRFLPESTSAWREKSAIMRQPEQMRQDKARVEPKTRGSSKPAGRLPQTFTSGESKKMVTPAGSNPNRIDAANPTASKQKVVQVSSIEGEAWDGLKVLAGVVIAIPLLLCLAILLAIAFALELIRDRVWGRST